MPIENRVPELVADKFGGVDRINLTHIQEATGLGWQTVSRWVKGNVTRIEPETLEAWCDYLGVEPGDILKYKPRSGGQRQKS